MLSDLALLSIIVFLVNIVFLFERTRIGVLVGVVSLLFFSYTILDVSIPAQPVTSLLFIVVSLGLIGYSLTIKKEKSERSQRS